MKQKRMQDRQITILSENTGNSQKGGYFRAIFLFGRISLKKFKNTSLLCLKIAV